MISSFQYVIRAVEERDRAWVLDFIIGHWGDDFVVLHEDIFYPHQLPGLIAETNKTEAVGLVTYQIRENQCEIITVNSLIENQGVGTKLIEVVIAQAREAGCSRLCLTTTNDNLQAIDFYTRKGFTLKETRLGAVDKARLIKPSIPNVSSKGIPIRDEWEFELILSA